MPAVMMPPVVVMAPVAVAADAARTIIGHDDAAAGRGVIGIIVVRVIVVVATGEEAPVVPVAKPMAAKTDAGANATASEHRAGAERAAMNGRAAADAAATPTVSTQMPTTTMPATTMPATAMPAATMPAADFRRQPIGSDLGWGDGTWIDQRQRLRAFAGGGREHQ